MAACALAGALVGPALLDGGSASAQTPPAPQAKPEATKPDATKPDARKAEAPKPDAQKPDAPKPESGKPSPAAMIVFDGSGSMWGRLEGDNRSNKLTVAREALRQALAKPGLAVKTGLASFGHRRRGDCSDVEIIAAPDAVGAARVMDPLDGLNPRGKGPVAAALRDAAKVLSGTRNSSIVLIGDNADNCQQDACAAAEEAAKTVPGLAVHVIGIALEPDEAKRMACVARGAGKFVNAEDATKLTAAIGEAMQLALKAPEQAPAAPAAAQVAPKPELKAPVSPQGAPGVASLGLSARLGGNGPAIDAPLHWRIMRSGETVPVIETDAKEILKPLAPGNYDVEARVGKVTARQTVVVPANGTGSAILPLEAGLVRYGLRNGKSADAVAGSVVSLIAASADGTALPDAQPIYLGRAPSGDLYVAPGHYILAVDQGTVRRTSKVDVTAGAVVSPEIQLGTGRLAVTAQAQEGAEPLQGVTFVVSVDDPDAPNGLREVARSAAPQPEFVLPTGTYQVTARFGSTETRQRVAVGAGDLVKSAVVLGLGKVQVTHALDALATKSGAAIETRVSRLDDADGRLVARAVGAGPSFTLPVGRYRVESSVGEQNARVAADLDLKPGTQVTVAMRIDTGQVNLRPANVALLPTAGDTLWEIRDARGRVVWRTIQAEPRALLLPGRYTVRSEQRGRSAEQTVDVAAGETRNVSAGTP